MSSTAGVEAPIRTVLEGVRRVGFGILEKNRDAESCPFLSCLGVSLECLGEAYGTTSVVVRGETWRDSNLYIHLMGASGAAFRLSWKPGWHHDNPSITHMSADPEEPYRRAFAAVGYDYEQVTKRSGDESERVFRQRIVESIADHCRPVLAIGVVGPPVCCVITGFDKAGEVLIGWSYFQDLPDFNRGLEFEPSGYFRKSGWYSDTEALIFIGKRRQRPPLGTVHRRALDWALRVIRTPVTSGDRRNGLAAYEAWAEALERDDDFPAANLGVLRERHMVHEDAVGTVAEGRWYAAQFLRQVAMVQPKMAPELRRASACLRAEHDLMWKIWDLVGGLGLADEYTQELAKPETRRRIVTVVLQAQEKNRQAAEWIERALSSRAG